MTTVVPFEHAKHRADVDAWCVKRGMALFPDGWLPQWGAIVPGVAAMWLYETDSAIAFVEDVISNPDTSPEQRGPALIALQEAVEARARSHGYRYLLGASRNPRLLGRAQAAGYVVTEPLRQLIKRLEATP